jgi:murein L,D-transpeptidase YafK
MISAARTRWCMAVLMGLSAAVTGLAQELPQNVKADRIVVLKSQRTLELMNHGNLLKSYKVALGGEPRGRKTRQNDHRTPEGTYILDWRNPASKFYKSIHISYPSAADRALAAEAGVPPGGDVFLHGLPNGYGWIGKGHRLKDWTDGCIAVTDHEMDEIWSAVPDGTPIEIRP